VAGKQQRLIRLQSVLQLDHSEPFSCSLPSFLISGPVSYICLEPISSLRNVVGLYSEKKNNFMFSLDTVLWLNSPRKQQIITFCILLVKNIPNKAGGCSSVVQCLPSMHKILGLTLLGTKYINIYLHIYICTYIYLHIYIYS
jgi:hypothetical protein